MSTNIEVIKRALHREKEARKQAEKILEDKSRALYLLSEELKDANEKLAQGLTEKTSELKGVFDNLIDAYVLMDLSGNIIKFNTSATELFGYDIQKEQLNVMSLIYKEDMKYAMTSFGQLVHEGSFADYNARVYTKNKGVRWVHINASIIFDAQKTPIGAQGIVKDITEQRTIEAENKTLLATLEKSNLELEEYAHVVSHDLKSPLRSINALVNWIKEDYAPAFDEAGLKHISMIESTLEKMERLINGILSYSSAGNGAYLEEHPIDLNTIISDIKNILLVPSHIHITIIKTLPTITGDATKIQQLFQNLISNAVHYIDKEIGLIEVDYEEQDTLYIFSIKDNGIGIAKEYHDKIFKIFQSLGDYKNSTGIGLSIVKKIVDLYGGEIWLDSEPTIGTTFHFSLQKQYNHNAT